jgi:hypothetical protein
MREPLYRAQRIAEEEAMWQGVKNLIRRMFFLPIKRTMREVKEEVLRKYGYSLTDRHRPR